MPRQARLDYEGCLHHLINRGLERRKLFLDRRDYETFTETLETVITEGKHRCYGWVLMPNHFHLLVETGQEPISRMMSRLQTRFAVTFNRRHRRTGVLFQNRYKSVVCDKDAYFKELVAYIHLNPLRAKLVENLESLESYPWSGHGALLGKRKVGWQLVEETLAHFGRRLSLARRSYLEFLASHRDMRRGELSGGGLMRVRGGVWEVMKTRQDRDLFDTRVLGEGDFVKTALVRGKKPMSPPGASGITVDVVGKRVAAQAGVSVEKLRSPGKSTADGVRGRSLLAYIGVTALGKTMVEIADYLGISQPAVSQLYRRGEAWAKENEAVWKAVAQ